jgi:hypothetical protein
MDSADVSTGFSHPLPMRPVRPSRNAGSEGAQPAKVSITENFHLFFSILILIYVNHFRASHCFATIYGAAHWTRLLSVNHQESQKKCAARDSGDSLYIVRHTHFGPILTKVLSFLSNAVKRLSVSYNLPRIDFRENESLIILIGDRRGCRLCNNFDRQNE